MAFRFWTQSAVAVLTAVSLAAAAPANAQLPAVDDAYNTGEYWTGTPARDLFWYFVNGQATLPTGGENAYVVGDPRWIDPPEGSSWVSLGASYDTDYAPVGWTTYYTTFRVTDPAAFFLAGVWASDNNAAMYLNGLLVGTIGDRAYKTLQDFKLQTGFQEQNTLAVQVYNGGGPAGLVVGDLQGTVTPEPATLLLVGTGLLGTVSAARRRRKREQPPA